MGKKFLIFSDVNGGNLYINKDYITHFHYDRETDTTKVYMDGESKPFVFSGDMTNEISREISALY